MFLYDVDKAAGRTNVYVGGLTTGAEILAGIRTVLADPSFDPANPILVDLRPLERTPSIAELRDIAIAVRTGGSVTGARRAIVTDSAVFQSMVELFITLSAGVLSEYRVFRSVPEADAWLRLPTPP